ncbi:Ig-like domain-containing protein [Shewanella pealeana]|uniref:Ig domain protein group 1 domain protein n=1 Tax=Shewanella pealeana (strain ATCC 700345 / ANG-SQ1) TaxID=398579 RepID=A8H916_SHEPA|nr:Ig-like domain-containing protein [Shewanella pealeana]ABV89053.1 Ig domain protein group 1 domain protein [Shewanella pealeana ATCC 700345]
MRPPSKLACLPLSLFCLSLLGGCNGSSDDNGDTDNGGTYALSLSYKTVENGVCAEPTNSQEFAANSSFCAVAHLKQGNSDRSGQLISFSTTIGELSVGNKLTNSNGQAEIIVSNPSGIADAGKLTASFNEGENSANASKNFEFTSATAPSEPKFSLNSAIINGTAVVTQFKADETVQLQAQFLDEQGQGIAGKMASFTAGSASLNPSSALTKENGIAQVSYTPSDSELGAANFSVTLDDNGKTYQSSGLYEVLAKDAVSDDGIIVIGHFSTDGSHFTENELATTLPLEADKYTVSAGGTFGVTADLATKNDDGSYTRLQTPTSVSFSSSCVSSNSASIDSPVTTLSGTASSTFQNTSCSGNSERNDQIIASVVAGNQTLTAELDFSLASQTLANLSFISAEPTSIRIKGAGGTNSSKSSLITFKVADANGQPIAQQDVDFSLDTSVGGIKFANGDTNTSNTSNSAGLVSTTVLSGTVPTPVRVLASATANGESVTTQSEQLTINTGLPQQLGFSLSSSLYNPEADNYDGEKATITAYASDSFGNPAPDDTTINFTAEGGQIHSNCVTVNGTCSVEWTSADPRVPDHRITVLAYALGHETFFDTNGNNVFDDADGGAITDACLNKDTGLPTPCTGNGMDIETYHPQGFSDLGDAFRDDNEDGKWDAKGINPAEPYFNTASKGEYQAADKAFNGPQCEGSKCGLVEEQANKTYIRKALVMTMSGSTAYFEIRQGNADKPFYSDISGTELANLTAIPAGTSSVFHVRFFDSANQIMPAQTTLTTTASQGELDTSPFTVPNRNDRGGSVTSFTLTNDIDPTSVGELAKSSSVSIDVKTPKSVESGIGFTVELSGT